MPSTPDPVQSLYRGMLALGAAGLSILTLGLLQFIVFEPPSQSSSVRATIEGVYQYDSASRQTIGSDTTHFQRNQDFAGVVDWARLPRDLVVAARWYDGFDQSVGGAGPAPAKDLLERRVIPVAVPRGLHYHLPGHYQLVVERFSHGQAVEVVARRMVRVDFGA